MILRLTVGLLILGATLPVDGKRLKPAAVQFKRITSTFNPRNLGLFEFFVTPNSDGQSVEMNARVLLNVTEEVHVAVSLLMRNQVKDLYKQILSYDFDVCRLGEQFMRQTIAKLWSKNIKKYSNLPLRCPIMAGLYYVKSMRLNTASVPVFLISGEYIVNVVAYIKIGGVKELLTKSSLEIVILKA